MRINTNVSALNSFRNLSNTESALGKSMEKLSSGFRINRAADDAAGLGIANQLRANTRALVQASRNAEQANSLLQIAEGSTDTIQNMLERMKELASQAASDTVDADGRTRLQAEFDKLVDEIDRTVDTTQFQGTKLLNGTSGAGSASLQFMVSSSGNATNDKISISLASLRSSALGTASSELSTLKSTTTGATTGTAASTFTGTESMTAGGTNTGTATAPTLDGTYSGAADATLDVKVDDSVGATTGTIEADDFVASVDGGTTWISLSQLTTDTGITVTPSATNAVDGDTWSQSLTAAVAASSGTTTGGLLTISDAEGTITSLDDAIKQVNKQLGDIGAAQSRIDYALENSKTAIQNFSAAESTIRDVDMAEEMTSFSKNQILQQAGTAMLAQANQLGQGVLQLLRG